MKIFIYYALFCNNEIVNLISLFSKNHIYILSLASSSNGIKPPKFKYLQYIIYVCTHAVSSIILVYNLVSSIILVYTPESSIILVYTTVSSIKLVYTQVYIQYNTITYSSIQYNTCIYDSIQYNTSIYSGIYPV